MKGDCVLFHGDPGEVEFVADPLVHEVGTQWYAEEFGGGIMLTKLKEFGSVFISDPKADDELEFVRRGDSQAVDGCAQ
jgi:hypothetical protein